MNLHIDLQPATPPGTFAHVTLNAPGLPAKHVQLDAVQLRRYGSARDPQAQDLLFVAALVYAADLYVPRRTFPDTWTRELTLSLPVADPALWQTARPRLEACLSFLSGDRWSIHFTQRDPNLTLWAPLRQPVTPPAVDAVSLFSGGLDSALGVAGYLADHPEQQLQLVGHADTSTSGTKADQREVYAAIQATFPGRTHLLQVYAGFRKREAAPERSMRSRSFLFLALGVYVANAQADGTPLLIPENGTIALNMPLTPSRTGSHSTRTAHPHFLQLFRSVLEALNLNVPVENPLTHQTKGEAVRACLDHALLAALAITTNSCAKTHRKGYWRRRGPGVKHCGQCMPCLYRRAALHTAGLDDGAQYGVDLCAGEVDLTGHGAGANDARALLYLLRERPAQETIEDRLFTNAPFPVPDRAQNAQLVLRTLDELRAWLDHKGRADVKAYAGL